MSLDERINTNNYNPDVQYSKIVEDILYNGHMTGDRTGVGTIATWHQHATFDLSEGYFPILSTKRVYWKTFIKEMLWFLKGETNIRGLLEQNVSIWTDWPLKKYRQETGTEITQELFEKCILKNDSFAELWGDIGPVYGKQWRRWEGKDGKETDQVAEAIWKIKNKPSDRRIIIEGWKVDELEEMALPPCHKTYQFQVTPDGRLNSIMFQRSCDTVLGLPANWVGQAALHLMIAHVTGMTPGKMVWVGSDVHIYKNAVEAVNLQLKREYRPMSKMRIVNRRESIDDFKIEDFVLEGYDPHPAIKVDVAV